MSRPSDTLMAWAAVGSRISGFHHDSASKLQSLMMALDEATELLGDRDAEVQRSLETATVALRELHALLAENRALAKAPQSTHTALPSLVQRAVERHRITLRGELPAVDVHVAPPSIVHALALLCDLLAGPPRGPRTIDIQVTPHADHVALSITGTPPAASVLDAIAVATWLVEREGGTVCSAPAGFLVHLPRSEGRSSNA